MLYLSFWVRLFCLFRLSPYKYRKSSLASSFFAVSFTSSISALTVLFPNWISRTSPFFTLRLALAVLPFTRTRPASQASFATVRRLIKREYQISATSSTGQWSEPCISERMSAETSLSLSSSDTRK